MSNIGRGSEWPFTPFDDKDRNPTAGQGILNPLLASLGNNLINYWRLEEAAGEVRVDSVGSLDMSEVGGTVNQGDGKIGNGADFPGSASDEYLSGGTSDSLNFDGTSDFTIAGWFKPDDVSVDRGIISKYQHSGNRKQWGVFIDDGGGPNIDFILSSNGITVFQAGGGTTTIVTGSFYFFWAEYNQATNGMRVQVNQEVISSVAGPSSIHTGPAVPRIGAHTLSGGDGNFEFDGVIDELAIWDRLLTAEEQSALYAGGKGGDLSTVL